MIINDGNQIGLSIFSILISDIERMTRIGFITITCMGIFPGPSFMGQGRIPAISQTTLPDIALNGIDGTVSLVQKSFFISLSIINLNSFL